MMEAVSKVEDGWKLGNVTMVFSKGKQLQFYVTTPCGATNFVGVILEPTSDNPGLYLDIVLGVRAVDRVLRLLDHWQKEQKT